LEFFTEELDVGWGVGPVVEDDFEAIAFVPVFLAFMGPG
jgi:hypothetical protein